MQGSSRDVADGAAPVLVSAPEKGHDIRAPLVFTFDEAIKLGSGTVTLFEVGAGTIYAADVSGNPHLTVVGNTLTFDPPGDLKGRGIYTVQFSPNAIADLAGNASTDYYSALFVTDIYPAAVDLTGGEQDDILHGSNFADTLHGGSGGNDSLFGHGGNDVLSGGDEPVRSGMFGDELRGGGGDDILYGNGGSDALYGEAGDDRLYGGADRDYLNGGEGDDLLDGGDGDDSFYDDSGENIMLGGDGDDFLSSQAGASGTLDGGLGNDTLVGSAAVAFIGGAGNDTFRVLLEGDATGGTVEGGAGDDRIELWWKHPAGARLDLSGGGGTETYVLQAADLADAVAAEVRIADFVAGANGERIDVRPLLPAGYDGNPFANGTLRLAEDGADTLLQLRATDAGGYHTLLRLAGVAPGSLTRENFLGEIDPGSSTRGLTLEGTAAADTLTGTLLDDTLYGRGGNDRLDGSGGDDTVDGGDGNDVLEGGSGDDVLKGGAGDDILDESGDLTGSDRLEGGAGSDTLVVGSGGDNVLLGGAGADTFVAVGQAKLRIEDFSTTGGDALDLLALLPADLRQNPFGSIGYLRAEQSGQNVLIHYDGDGAAGAAQGYRLLATLANVNLASLNGTHFAGRFHPDGRSLNQTITGTPGNDTLAGGMGDDTIRGLAGVDSIDGGNGHDLIEGGDEAFYGDTLNGGAGNDILRGDGGHDWLNGDGGDDRLEGGEGGDVLDGGAGDDLLYGGAGRDTLNDATGGGLLDGGDGDDLIQAGLRDAGSGLAPGVMTVAGGAGSDRILAALSVAGIDGGDGDDHIFVHSFSGGIGGVLRVTGGDGDDILELPGDASGERPSRTIEASGGAGRETYVLAAQAARQPLLTITDFQAGAGGDVLDISSVFPSPYESFNPFGAAKMLQLVQRGADAVLQRNLGSAGAPDWTDVAVLRGTQTATMVSENFSDGARPDGSPVGWERTGTAGPDSMRGGRLDDRLRGGDGNDFLEGENGNDHLHGEGGHDKLDGGSGDDQLWGGDGDDSLDGGAGSNRLDGGSGDDELYADGVGDVLLGGEGNDTLASNSAGALLDGGDGADRITVAAPFPLVQGAIDFTVHGGAGDDRISFARSENARIAVTADGGAGNDTWVIGGRQQGSIRILDFVAGEGGELLDLTALLRNSWDPAGPNPFAAGGLLKTIQRGADTVLQLRVETNGVAAYEDLVTLANIDKRTLTADNISLGLNPDGSTQGRTIHGTPGADQLVGGWLDDTVDGGAGDDVLWGGAGDDTLEGGDGNDTLTGDVLDATQGFDTRQTGDDVLDGGAGDDLLSSQWGSDVLRGGDGNDTLRLTWAPFPERRHEQAALHGGAGDDRFEILAGADARLDVTLAGGAGRDTFAIDWLSGAGVGTLAILDFEAGEGGDVLDVFTIFGVDYTDISPFASGQVRLQQDGADTVLWLDPDGAGALSEQALVRLKDVDASSLTAANMAYGLSPDGSTRGLDWTGSGGNDVYTAGWLDDVLRGGDGNDVLDGGGGNDLLDGGAGNDRLTDLSGANTLLGGAGDDTLTSRGDGVLRGGDGQDVLVTLGGNATLEGGEGNDILHARREAGTSPDARPVLLGGAGDDIFYVGEGLPAQRQAVAAIATGGAGVDTFVAGYQLYTVTDFQAGSGGDTIALHALGLDLGATPFARGYLRLVQSGADTRLEVDRDAKAGGAGFEAVMLLKNVNAASLTTANFAQAVDLPGPALPPNPPAPPTPPVTPPAPPVTPPVAVDPPVSSVGSSGHETLTGGSGNDRLDGGEGNDMLAGGAGNDVLIGGAGIDSARFTGASSNYTVTRGENGIQVVDKRASGDGSDLLTGVERLVFADQHLALDIDGVAGQAFRIYRAAFDRTPDMGGMGFYLSVLDRGVSLYDVAASFMASQEFTDMYGSAPDNADIVMRLYRNILHREPEQGGYDFWLDILDSKKADLAAVLEAFSEGFENRDGTAELIANGVPFLPYG